MQFQSVEVTSFIRFFFNRIAPKGIHCIEGRYQKEDFLVVLFQVKHTYTEQIIFF